MRTPEPEERSQSQETLSRNEVGGLPGLSPEALTQSGEGSLVALALARDDQRRRWQEGNRVPVEAYLKHFPALKANPERVLDLIYSEVLLHEELGESPALQDYLGRFPQHEAALRRQVALRPVLSSALRTQSAPGRRQAAPFTHAQVDGPPPSAALPAASQPVRDISQEVLRLGLPALRTLRDLLGPHLPVWLLPAAALRPGGQVLDLNPATDEEPALLGEVRHLVASLWQGLGDDRMRWAALLLALSLTARDTEARWRRRPPAGPTRSLK